MSAAPGTTIGPYTIDAEIGRGGMGIVYRAHDTRLDRAVAIKALPEHLAEDPERLARFEREAKLLASLTHPNIAGVYGLEETDGARYLVLEYIEGESLADRLDRGALPVDEALELAAQVAAGVEAAHEAGVIHRDLKPGNIIVTTEGKAKVLDFGLARAEEVSASSSDLSMTPTMTSPASPHSPTTPGAILGTAPYMSPEQARGRRVDKRSDIWSFGVVLYEMLTGASPFIGETATDSIGAILHKQVDLDRLPEHTPRTVRHIIERCLERDRNQRLRDIGDARIEIERAQQAPLRDEAPARAGSSVRPAIVAALIIVSAAIGLVAGVSLDGAPQEDRAVIRATIEPGEDVIVSYLGDVAGPATLSRDGSQIVFVGKRTGEAARLYIRPLDADLPEPIRGTDGATFPFWSWDGQSIGYFAGGELRRYDLVTRTNRTVCAAPGGRGGAWLADDTIVFAPQFQSTLHRVPAEGGESAAATSRIEARHSSHRWPRPTPDGEGFTYLAVSHTPGRLDESAVFLSRPGLAADVEITRAYYAASIVDDHLLVARDGALYAAPIDASSGRITGPERLLLDGIVTDLSTWVANFSAVENGALVYHGSTGAIFEDRYVPGGVTFGEARRTTLYDRTGRPVYIAADGVPQNSVALAPTWDQLAISAAPGITGAREGFDIWIYPLPKQTTDPSIGATVQPRNLQADLQASPRRLTFMQGAEVVPRWSPDGAWIAFSRIFTDETWGLYRVREGGGQPELLLEQEAAEGVGLFPVAWSPDGRHLAYRQGSWISDQQSDMFVLDIDTGETSPLILDGGDQASGEISPDGRWFTFDSNETGDWEVNVIPFPPAWEDAWAAGDAAPARDARWRISIAGGRQPRWSPVGNELFYISSSNTVIAVPVTTDGPGFQSGVGTPLFDARMEDGDIAVAYEAQRFAINSAGEEQRTAISILTNWQELLSR